MAQYFEIKDQLTRLSRVDETNYLLGFIGPAQNNWQEFGEGDIRWDYFDFVRQLIQSNSMNLKNFYLRFFSELEVEKLVFDIDLFKHNVIIRKSLKDHNEDVLREKFSLFSFKHRSLKTNLDRNLLIESWSLFEHVITTIYEFVLTDNEIELAKRKYFNDFVKILKKHYPDSDQEKVKEVANLLSQKTDSFVPTIKKINKIFKKRKLKYEEKDQDLEFLEVYGRLRNGIHNNFIYKGPNKKPYIFNGNQFNFEDGKPIIEEASDMFAIVALLGKFLPVVHRVLLKMGINQKIQNPTPS